METEQTSDHRIKFTYEEDEQLLQLIQENGPKRWKFIARKMVGKTARQCRDRYMNYLREGISNDPWTEEEDNLLTQKVGEFGTHWSKLTPFFVGRSANNIKNRWYTFHMKKKMKIASSLLPQSSELIKNNKDLKYFIRSAHMQLQKQQNQTETNLHKENSVEIADSLIDKKNIISFDVENDQQKQQTFTHKVLPNVIMPVTKVFVNKPNSPTKNIQSQSYPNRKSAPKVPTIFDLINPNFVPQQYSEKNNVINIDSNKKLTEREIPVPISKFQLIQPNQKPYLF